MFAHPPMTDTLDDLRPACIRRVHGFADLAEDVRCRLVDLGLDEGSEVERVAAGPINGDPIAVRVGNHMIAVRRAVARCILLDPAPAP
jgi:Fe2+ transport system protein FeoA